MISSALFNISVLAFSGAATHLSSTGCSLGEIYAFSIASCEVTLTNLSDEPTWAAIKPPTVEDAAFPEVVYVPPKGSSSFIAYVSVGGSSGEFAKSFIVKSIALGEGRASVRVNGFAMTTIDEANPSITFGKINPKNDATLSRRALRIGSHEVAYFQILRALDVPSWLDISIDSDGQGIVAEVRPDAPWGRLRGVVELALNTPNQRKMHVEVSAEIEGDVRPASSRFWMGTIPEDRGLPVNIQLSSTTGSDFRIDSVSISGLSGEAYLTPCSPIRNGCQNLSLTFANEARAGILSGKVVVNFSDVNRSLIFDIWGVFKGGEYGLTLGSDSIDLPWLSFLEFYRSYLQSGHSSEYSPKNVLSHSFIGTRISNADNKNVTLNWTVENDGSAYGYQVFRAERVVGPFLLVSDRIVHAYKHERGAGFYKWMGSQSVGKEYWYVIGVVGKDGTKQILPGPQRKLLLPGPSPVE